LALTLLRRRALVRALRRPLLHLLADLERRLRLRAVRALARRLARALRARLLERERGLPRGVLLRACRLAGLRVALLLLAACLALRRGLELLGTGRHVTRLLSRLDGDLTHCARLEQEQEVFERRVERAPVGRLVDAR